MFWKHIRDWPACHTHRHTNRIEATERYYDNNTTDCGCRNIKKSGQRQDSIEIEFWREPRPNYNTEGGTFLPFQHFDFNRSDWVLSRRIPIFLTPQFFAVENADFVPASPGTGIMSSLLHQKAPKFGRTHSKRAHVTPMNLILDRCRPQKKNKSVLCCCQWMVDNNNTVAPSGK